MEKIESKASVTIDSRKAKNVDCSIDYRLLIDISNPAYLPV